MDGMGEGSGPTDITDLGHEVFQIDTRMAGYDGITAGYLIRGDRPCLVETGTAPSAPVVRDALARLEIGAGDLATVGHPYPPRPRGRGRRHRRDVPGGPDRRAPAGRAAPRRPQQAHGQRPARL